MQISSGNSTLPGPRPPIGRRPAWNWPASMRRWPTAGCKTSRCAINSPRRGRPKNNCEAALTQLQCEQRGLMAELHVLRYRTVELAEELNREKQHGMAERNLWNTELAQWRRLLETQFVRTGAPARGRRCATVRHASARAAGARRDASVDSGRFSNDRTSSGAGDGKMKRRFAKIRFRAITAPVGLPAAGTFLASGK